MSYPKFPDPNITTRDSIDFGSDCSDLPMTQIMNAWKDLRDRHDADLSEVVLNIDVDYSDSVEGGVQISLVFERKVPNDNYQQELKIWEAYQKQKQRERDESNIQLKLERESLAARQEWKKFNRSERIARRNLGD